MIYNDKDAIEYTQIPFSSFNQDVKTILIKQLIEIVCYFCFENIYSFIGIHIADLARLFCCMCVLLCDSNIYTPYIFVFTAFILCRYRKLTWIEGTCCSVYYRLLKAKGLLYKLCVLSLCGTQTLFNVWTILRFSFNENVNQRAAALWYFLIFAI
jgi:hypothetical protein